MCICQISLAPSEFLDRQFVLGNVDGAADVLVRALVFDSRSADVDVLSFGNNPKGTTAPKFLCGSTIKFRF